MALGALLLTKRAALQVRIEMAGARRRNPPFRQVLDQRPQAMIGVGGLARLIERNRQTDGNAIEYRTGHPAIA